MKAVDITVDCQPFPHALTRFPLAPIISRSSHPPHETKPSLTTAFSTSSVAAAWAWCMPQALERFRREARAAEAREQFQRLLN
jgi:hypothetical protein